MSDLAAGTRTYLLTVGALTALVVARITLSPLPQNSVMPAITYQFISDVHELLHDGPQGLPTARIQYDCWGATHKSAHDVADVLRVAVDGYRGAMGAVTVTRAAVENMLDVYEPVTQKYRVIVDVTYQRSE